MQNAFSIAMVTIRELLRQPLIYLLLGCFLALTWFLPYIVLFDFASRFPMVMEMGVSSFLLWGLLLILVSLHATLTPEMENRTLMTLLAKPVGRGEFLAGKFMGVSIPMIVGLVPIVIVFLFVLHTEYHEVVEREITNMGRFSSEADQLLEEERLAGEFWSVHVIAVIQGAVLAAVHGCVLAAIGVTLSANLPGLLGIISTFLAYVVGHLLGFVVLIISDFLPAIGDWLITGVSWLFPQLEAFNVVDLIGQGVGISLEYFVAAVSYGLFYCAFILLVGGRWFTRKEMA
jgi:hypothetical protein